MVQYPPLHPHRRPRRHIHLRQLDDTVERPRAVRRPVHGGPVHQLGLSRQFHGPPSGPGHDLTQQRVGRQVGLGFHPGLVGGGEMRSQRLVWVERAGQGFPAGCSPGQQLGAPPPRCTTGSPRHTRSPGTKPSHARAGRGASPPTPPPRPIVGSDGLLVSEPPLPLTGEGWGEGDGYVRAHFLRRAPPLHLSRPHPPPARQAPA